MTQSNGFVDANWRMKVFNTLWLESHARHQISVRGRRVEVEGLHVKDAAFWLLRRVKIDWKQYAQPGSNEIEKWLIQNFPVSLQDRMVEGERYKAVVFHYVSKADYAACVLQEKLPAMPVDQRTETAVKQMLRREYGIDEDAFQAAFNRYPRSLQMAGGVCTTLPAKLVVDMPEDMRSCVMEAFRQALGEAQEHRIPMTGVPAVVPVIKNYYPKNGMGTWIEENFPELAIRPREFGSTIKVLTFKDGGDSWKIRALKALWDEAHKELHPIVIRGQRVEIEGGNVYDVSNLLRDHQVEWTDYTGGERMNMTDWLTKNFPICVQPRKVGDVDYTAFCFQYKSKADYAACLLSDRMKNGSVSYDVLVREMAEYGLTEMNVAEAFRAYPQNLKKNDDVCWTVDKLVVEMPRQILPNIQEELKKAIESSEKQYLLLSDVPAKVPWIKHYYDSLQLWLRSNFNFQFLENPASALTLNIADTDIGRAQNVIRDQLNRFRGQSARIDELDELAMIQKFDLKTIKGDRPQEEWLGELLKDTEIRLTEDGESVYIPLPEGQLDDMPVRPHREGEEEIQQAMNMCYFGWEILRQMLFLTGRTGQETVKAAWNRYFAHVLAQAMSGVEGELMADSDTGRLVLPLRLYTRDEVQLYSILEKNTNPNQQMFKLAAIVYPGQENENGYGRYLCERFGLAGGSAGQNTYDSLQDKLEQVQALQVRLQDALGEAERYIREGRAGDLKQFSDDIGLWQNCWAELDEIITNLGWKYDMPDPTIGSISERVMASSAENQMLEEVISQFDSMVDTMDRFMEETPPFNGMYAGYFQQCRDQMKEDRKFTAEIRITSEQDFTAFKQILNDYRAFQAIACAADLNVDPQTLSTVCGHFKMLPAMAGMFTGMGLPMFGNEPMLACLNQLDEICKALDDVILYVNRKTARSVQAKPGASADQLLSWLMERSDEDEMREVGNIFPENELEALIVRGDWDQAEMKLQAEEPSQTRDAMLKGIEQARTMSASLSLTAIARRLLAVVGNRNRSAEKYLLASCLLCIKDVAEAKSLLLDIYQDENRMDAFEALVCAEDIEGDLNKQRYYLKLLCQKEYEAARAYADGHIYLLYDQECLDAVRCAAIEAGDAAFAGRLVKITVPAGRNAVKDETVQAIIEGDLKRLAGMADHQQTGLEGYSDEEFRQLQAALMDLDAFPMGKDDAAVGCRLHLCIGNRGRLAERYLWDALSSGKRSVYGPAAIRLVVILAEEERWEECCRVFERYQAECSADDASRRAYLASRLNTDPGSVVEEIRENLTDVLMLYAGGEKGRILIDRLQNHENPEVAAFYEQIGKLCSHLNEEFPRCVILLGRELRELLAQPERVREMGFSEAEEERMKLLRRTNDYPQGMNAAAIAERAYRFMGIRDGVAESFARFDQERPEAVELLHRIYLEQHDQVKLLGLMKAFSDLREAYWEEYCQLLFHQDEDELLREAFALRNPETPNQLMIAQILSVRAEETVTADFDLCVHEMLDVDADLTAELIVEMARCSMTDGIFALIHANIVRMLDEWSIEKIVDLLSGKGEIAEEKLYELQERALEEQCDQLAVFLWTRMGIGELHELADKLYDRMMAETACIELQEQMKALERVQKLFPDRENHLAIQALALQISQQTDQTGDLTAMAVMISEKLKGIQLSDQMLRNLLQAMNTELCVQEAVCAQMEQLSQQSHLLPVILERYYDAAQEKNDTTADERFADFMAKLYLHAIHADSLQETMLAPVESQCLRFVQEHHTEAAMLCLVYIERKLGRENRADYALYALSDAQAAGGEPDSELQRLLSDRWPEELPSASRLFRKVLVSCSADEIYQYCEFAGKFVDQNPVIPQFGSTDRTDELLSETECTLLLNSLYACPEQLERWNECSDRLPMQGEPAAKARLKLICCQKSGINRSTDGYRGKGEWWKCAKLCFDWELDELLLETLVSWSEQSEKYLMRNNTAFLMRCRDFVEERVREDEEFLNYWLEGHTEELRTLLRRFFLLVPDHMTELQKTAIIVTSCLTAALRDREILKEFIDDKKQLLLNEWPNLGFALFCRLMLAKRWEEAGLMLNELGVCIDRCAYRELMEYLMPMSAEELRQWSERPANRALLQLAIPDGQAAPVETLNAWAVECIRSRKEEEGVELCSWLCRIFPDDKSVSRINFFMLKNSGLDGLPAIHQALCRIIRGSRIDANQEEKDRKPFDIRTTEDYGYLLAGVNAVLLDNGRTQACADYDFSRSAGDYYRECTMDTSDADQKINSCQKAFSDAMQNRSVEERRRIWRVITSWVTGDWFEVLNDSWMNWQEWSLAWTLSLPVEAHGLARSAVKFLMTMKAEDRDNARLWIRDDCTKVCEGIDGAAMTKKLRMIMEQLKMVDDQEAAEDRMKAILDHPLEEPGLVVQMLESILNPELLSDMNSARQYAAAAFALMCNRRSVGVSFRTATEAFEAHEDRKASALFYALSQCATWFGLTHVLKVTDPREINYLAQRYMRYQQVIALLSDDPQLRSAKLQENITKTYFNLTMQLVTTQRADEALLLRRRFPEARRAVVDAVLFLIDQSKSDEDKLAFVGKLTDHYVRKGSYFLMSLWDNSSAQAYQHTGRSRFIRKVVRLQQTAIECAQLNKQIDGMYGEFIYTRYLLEPDQWKITHQIQPPLEEQADEMLLEEAAEREKEIEIGSQTEQLIHEISQQMQLTPLSEEADEETPEALLQRYGNIENMTQEGRTERAALSKRICRMALAGRGALKCIDELVRYSMDSFMAGVGADYSRCLPMLQAVPLVGYASDRVRSDFRSIVNNSALTALLKADHDSLRETLGEFFLYRNHYRLMMEMLSDEEALKTVQGIYKALDLLHGAYEKQNLSDIEPLKDALKEASRALSDIQRNYNKRGWTDTAGPLMNRILAEFNRLDEQPRLVLRVLNEGAGRSRGKFFGQVENIGRSEARDIQLWITYGDGKVSAPHRLALLMAGGKAVFDIGYQVEEEAEKLSYRVDATCMSRSGARLQAETVSGEFMISSEELPFFDTGDMNMQTIMDFKPNDDNTDVYSDDFIGRESEKRRLRSLYDRKSFAACRNAVVYGIRRAGKTSLLNYICAYLNCVRDDLKAVVVSGQSASTVYGVFVREVLFGLKNRFAAWSDEEADHYAALESKWMRTDDTTDIDPAELKFFYSDVKTFLNGRGLVVIVDEFDRLLEKLDAQQNLETRFYPVLSSMLCDSVCAETVHFLFCGSKELIIEKNKDRQITQIFQRMGESDILIGAMPKQEMISLMTSAYSQYECVKFTDAALDWLWTMAGGLVWFSKLIAKEALERAEQDERSVVYPSDIFKAAAMISASDGLCKQFYESFREDERFVVEAMGHLAVRPEQYVAVGQVSELLQGKVTRERVERAMRNLIDLEMVESSRQNASLYRFRVELYRRYFRAQTEYPRILSKNEGQDVNFQIVLNG